MPEIKHQLNFNLPEKYFIMYRNHSIVQDKINTFYYSVISIKNLFLT